MKKYFVCSDIHGFYDEWLISLKKAGFDRENPKHILIILGDLFDRGDKPWEVYQYIISLPEDRVILVKGNHEYLLLELVRRKCALSHDEHNGTYGTLLSLYKDPMEEQTKWIHINQEKYRKENNPNLYSDSNCIYDEVEKKLYDNDKINQIVEWIKSPRWINYYELGKYIFVHSFIPLKGIDNIYKIEKAGIYYPNWRKENNQILWEMATWGCPYRRYLDGSFDEELKNGKVLVCGHWHTSDFYNVLEYGGRKKIDIRIENPIYKSDKHPGIIALDACTALTGKVNILIIDESEINIQ